MGHGSTGSAADRVQQHPFLSEQAYELVHCQARVPYLEEEDVRHDRIQIQRNRGNFPEENSQPLGIRMVL